MIINAIPVAAEGAWVEIRCPECGQKTTTERAQGARSTHQCERCRIVLALPKS